MSPERLVAGVLFVAAAAFYVYYTLWTLVTPFIDRGHVIQSFFPDREWALRLPILVGVFGLTAVGLFFGLVLVKSRVAVD